VSVIVDESSRVVVLGIGRPGVSALASRMASYGTSVVAGVGDAPGEGSQRGIPIYGQLHEAIEATRPNVALIVESPRAVLAATLEALDREIRTLIIATPGVSDHDAGLIFEHAHAAAARVVGPGSPGIVNPGSRTIVGEIGGDEAERAFPPGRIGIIACGASPVPVGLTIKRAGLGVSTAVGVGDGGPVGTSPATLLPLFQRDPETDGVVLVGEPGARFEGAVVEVLHSRRYIKMLFAVGARDPSPLVDADRYRKAAMIGRGGMRHSAANEALREAGALVADELADLVQHLSLVYTGQPFLGRWPTISI
jgi:succinyl-CoA synthetase alpha subunit